MDTSAEARRSLTGLTQAMRDRILAHIEYYGGYGATCDEVERALEMKHQTASARIRELTDLNRIVNTGRTRRTRSGRAARVYVVKHDPQQLRLL